MFSQRKTKAMRLSLFYFDQGYLYFFKISW